VAQIAGLEADASTADVQLGRERLAVLDVEVEESHPRLLPGEGANDFHPDARRAAGHDDGGVPEAGVHGKRPRRDVGHGWDCTKKRRSAAEGERGLIPDLWGPTASTSRGRSKETFARAEAR